MRIKLNILSVSIFISIFSTISFGQNELFIPRNILSAYEKGTRSFDGKPGAEYWQNSSDYKIFVNVNPLTYIINGTEEITYHNNSPDSLNRIVLRLYPNIYKKGSSRDYAISPEAVDDGILVKEISINGQTINLENVSRYRVQSSTAIIYLSDLIPPKASAKLSITWSFKLSSKAKLRMGVYDSTTAFVGYWYPQISVYDDIDGWDYYNYDGQTEFYNDFSNFEVNITIPNNFGIWATGELQNPESVFKKNFYNKYQFARHSDSVFRIITSNDLISGDIFNNHSKINTWIFKANSVTDFAFAFSDHYLWDGVTITKFSDRDEKIFLQAIYPSDSTDFKDVAEISKNLVRYFSEVMPGIDFPFTSFVAFNNGRTGGGMEFPMMINDGSPDSFDRTVDLTAHEMAHQYFPFLVGTNEKKYAFMDEGWAVMLPFNYMKKFEGINTRLISTVANYEIVAGTEDDIAPMIISNSLSYGSYRNAAYNRPAMAYELLNDMLGDKLFVTALREYIKRWKGKHPGPYDMFFTFNDITGQNLNWFWTPWFFDFGYPDLAIDKVEIENTSAKILIRKNGSVPTPVHLKLIYQDETEDEIYQSSEVWKDGKEIFEISVELKGILNEIQLGSLTIPDSNRDNNIYLVH